MKKLNFIIYTDSIVHQKSIFLCDTFDIFSNIDFFCLLSILLDLYIY